jgi:transcriptional regulator, PadR family
MAIDKSLLTGSTTMLILRLLEEADMYGYQMIEELSKKSNNVFALKAGTLYPLLHNLEQKNWSLLTKRRPTMQRCENTTASLKRAAIICMRKRGMEGLFLCRK